MLAAAFDPDRVRGRARFWLPALVSRSLLVVSLGAFDFIHLWLNKQQSSLRALRRQIAKARPSASQNAELARLVTAASHDSGTIAEAKKYVASSRIGPAICWSGSRRDDRGRCAG